MRVLFLSLVAAIALTGCATAPVESFSSRAMRLSIDMSKDQVISVMGTPRKTAAKKAGENLTERYFWWSPGRVGFTAVDNEMLSPDRVFVRFVNGKVVEWGDKYDYTAMMDNVTDAQREMLKAMRPASAASAP